MLLHPVILTEWMGLYKHTTVHHTKPALLCSALVSCMSNKNSAMPEKLLYIFAVPKKRRTWLCDSREGEMKPIGLKENSTISTSYWKLGQLLQLATI